MHATTTLTLILALTAPAPAQEGKPERVPPRDTEATGLTEREVQNDGADAIEQEIRALERQVLAGEARSEAFAGLKEQVRLMGEASRASHPRASELSRRLARRIGDLEKRARRGAASAEDFAILREQMIDARVDNVIARLAARDPGDEAPGDETRGPRPQELQRLAALLEERAAVVRQIDPEAGRGSENVIRTLNRSGPGQGTEGLQTVDLSQLRRSLAESRLERALADLEKRALANTATQEDYTRVREVIADRTETLGTPEAAALEDRLQNAIDTLKAKAATGELTREEFAKVRENLLEKARAAADGAERG